LDIRLNAMTGEYINTFSVSKNTYGTQGGGVPYSESTFYNHTGPNYLLANSVTTRSDGDFNVREFTYISDGVPNSVESDMYQRNMLTSVTSVVNNIRDSEGNDTHALTQRRSYVNKLEAYVPGTIEEKIVDGGFIERESYVYDNDGNLVQSYSKDGNRRISTHLWGYEGKAIVAIIENATYESVKLSLGNAVLDQLYNSTDAAFILQTVNTARTALANARVTTYVHDLGRGPVTIVDPSGISQHFDYDAAGRPLHIRDFEQNILQQNEYNYRSN